MSAVKTSVDHCSMFCQNPCLALKERLGAAFQALYRRAKIDPPFVERFGNERQRANHAAVPNIPSRKHDGTATDHRVSPDTDRLAGDIATVRRHARTDQSLAGIIVARGVDTDPLREAGKVAERQILCRAQMAVPADMNAVAKANPPASSDDGCIAIDTDVIAEADLVQPMIVQLRATWTFSPTAAKPIRRSSSET